MHLLSQSRVRSQMHQGKRGRSNDIPALLNVDASVDSYCSDWYKRQLPEASSARKEEHPNLIRSNVEAQVSSVVNNFRQKRLFAKNNNLPFIAQGSTFWKRLSVKDLGRQ